MLKRYYAIMASVLVLMAVLNAFPFHFNKIKFNAWLVRKTIF